MNSTPPVRAGHPTSGRLVLTAAFALTVLYLALRLPALTTLPLFNDEAVYLLRAQRFPEMLRAWGVAGATLPDGKLIQELVLAALALLPGDPLIPARLLSVACGLGTTLALVGTGRVAGLPGAGLLAGLLYALAPLAQIHEVLALPDALLTMVSALLLWASLRFGLATEPGRRNAAMIGAILAVACLVKLTGLLLAGVPALAALLLAPSRAEALRRLGLLRLALIIALACLAALAPFHYGGAERSKMGEAGESRTTAMARNIGAAGDWALRYLPGTLALPPLLVLVIAPTARQSGPATAGTAGTRRLVGYLIAAGLSTIGLLLLIGTTIYPRYFMPAWPPLLLGCAVACTSLWRRGGAGQMFAALCLAGAVVWGGAFAWRLAADPTSAPMAALDRAQYLERWTAGHQLEVLLDDLRAAASYQTTTVVLNDQPRLVTMATHLYLDGEEGLRLVNLDLAQANVGEHIAEQVSAGPVLIVVDSVVAQSYDLERRLPGLRLLHSYRGPGGDVRLRSYSYVAEEADSTRR